jgi:hypothetical protein
MGCNAAYRPESTRCLKAHALAALARVAAVSTRGDPGFQSKLSQTLYTICFL